MCGRFDKSTVGGETFSKRRNASDTLVLPGHLWQTFRMHGDQKTQTDEEVRAILVQSLVEVEADPAIIYAFHKTGVYVCDENERWLSAERLAAWNAAIEKFRSSVLN